MDRCTDALVAAMSCSQSLLGYPTTLADDRRTTDLVAACNCVTQLVERYQFNSQQLTRLRNAIGAARVPDQSTRCLTGDFGLVLISMKAKRLDFQVD
jgi:hypothetical protein